MLGWEIDLIAFFIPLRRCKMNLIVFKSPIRTYRLMNSRSLFIGGGAGVPPR